MFRSWLETNEDREKELKRLYLSYIPGQGWSKGRDSNIYLLGGKSKDGPYVSIEGIGRHYPELNVILKDLLDKYPEVSNWGIMFDGPAQETVAQALARTSDEFFMGIPKKFYHGTSTWHYDQAMYQGELRPRGATGVDPSYQMSAAAGNPDTIYLMDNDGNAVRFAAREASAKARHQKKDDQWADPSPIILEVDGTKLSKGKFVPDEDAHLQNITTWDSDWKKSIWAMGSVGYQGAIPIDATRVHLIYDPETNGFKLA